MFAFILCWVLLSAHIGGYVAVRENWSWTSEPVEDTWRLKINHIHTHTHTLGRGLDSVRQPKPIKHVKPPDKSTDTGQERVESIKGTEEDERFSLHGCDTGPHRRPCERQSNVFHCEQISCFSLSRPRFSRFPFSWTVREMLPLAFPRSLCSFVSDMWQEQEKRRRV